MARVIFVNRFYWPDEPATGQLLTDLAEAMAARGHRVTVITSGAGDTPNVEERRGVRILRVRSRRASDARLRGKALDWGAFLLAAMGRLLREARRGTVIVAMTDPPLLAIAAWFVAGMRGARLVHWVQDIYPELAIEIAGQRWLAALRPLRNMAWRGAVRCATLGSDMAATLLGETAAPERLSIIPNWSPVDAPPERAGEALRVAWGLVGKFVVGYSGNLGRVHDVDAIVALAEALRNEAAIRFVIVGSGAQRSHLEAEVTRRGLASVSFHAPQPRAQLAEALSVADVHLVTLRAGCERYVFPSKLYGIAAVGRPVIFIGARECEVARCVTANAFGYAGSREDVAAAAAFIRQLAADPAQRADLGAAAQRFAAVHTFDRAAEAWHGLLEHATS